MSNKYLSFTVIILLLIILLQHYNKKQITTNNHIVEQKIDAPIEKTDETVTVTPPVIIPPVKDEKPVVIEAVSLDDAIKKSKEQNKKILIFFHAPWCYNCEIMLKYFPNEQVNAALSNYILYKPNTDVERKISSKYNVNGIPMYIIIDQNEKIIKKGVGMITSQQFITWLNNKPSKASK